MKLGHCLIIDPGEEGQRIISEIEKAGLTPSAILLTHAHFDHIGAVDTVRDKFNIPVYIHEVENDWLADPSLNGSIKYPGLPLVTNRKADHLLRTDGIMEVGPFTFETRHTPGHSPGSVSFIFEEARIAIVGDTLFQGVSVEPIYLAATRTFYLRQSTRSYCHWMMISLFIPGTVLRQRRNMKKIQILF